MVPDDLRYTREHEWARVDGDQLTIGVTEYAQRELGDVVYVELPQVGDALDRMSEFGTVESIKAVSALFSPVAGTVLAVNDTLNTEPESVNSDPYGAGWMIKLSASDISHVDELLDAASYTRLVDELRA